MPSSDIAYEEIYNSEGTSEVTLETFKEHVMKAAPNAKRPLNDEEIQKLFDVCDVNQDNKLSKKELSEALGWLRPIFKPKTALINVDVQNDFIKGTMALCNCPSHANGEEVIPVINHLTENRKFDLYVYTLDFHPERHISFIDNVGYWKLDKTSEIQDPEKVKVCDVVVFNTPRWGPVEQKIWPKHCVQNTYGCEIHEDLKVVEENKVIVKKGIYEDVESYTAFGAPAYDAETNLDSELKKHEITELYITGLALDICVANTGLDALKLNYSVCMVEDAQRGVAEDTIKQMKEEVTKEGGLYVSSTEVLENNGITPDDRLDTLRRRLDRITLAKQEDKQLNTRL